MTSPRLFVAALDGFEALAPRDWRDSLSRAIHGGARVVTMFGAPADGDRVAVTAILDDASAGGLAASRTIVERDVGYPSLTPEYAALHCFERELHEQHRVRLPGHPWLKPIRFEGSGREALDAYPFYEVQGKEVHEVAVGPIHAGVIEPGCFRFMCSGEEVHHLEIHLGYQHRGVEPMLLGRDPRALGPLVETIAGDASIAHAWAYAAAIEALAETPAEADVDAARAALLELERIGMHLAGLAGLAADVGFLQGASTYGRLRTTAINATMRICGSRFGRGAIRPGGSRASLESAAELSASLDEIAADVATIDDCFFSARTVRHRLQGVGTVTTDLAREIGLVGLAARSSGVALDLRTRGPGVYARHPVEATVERSGDCWARARVRAREIASSLAFLRSLIEGSGWRVSTPRVGRLAPRRLVVAMTEGWRGETVHALQTGDDGQLVHYKVQDPSFRNWLGLALAVRGNEISDFPICNKSFDLSYCGSDL